MIKDKEKNEEIINLLNWFKNFINVHYGMK